MGFSKRFHITSLCLALSLTLGLSQMNAHADDFQTDEISRGGEISGADRSIGNVDNFDLDILTNNVSRIKIENTGAVGIGTSSPNQPLEVNGTIKSIETNITPVAAVINIDWSQGNQQTVLLNQAGHTVNFTNVFPGQIFRLVACQDNTGGRTITTWDSTVRFTGGATTVTLSSAADTCDVISFIATDAAGVAASTVVLGTIVRDFSSL